MNYNMRNWYIWGYEHSQYIRPYVYRSDIYQYDSSGIYYVDDLKRAYHPASVMKFNKELDV